MTYIVEVWANYGPHVGFPDVSDGPQEARQIYPWAMPPAFPAFAISFDGVAHTTVEAWVANDTHLDENMQVVDRPMIVIETLEGLVKVFEWDEGWLHPGEEFAYFKFVNNQATATSF